MSTKDLGKNGEDSAEKYLKNKGYKILERNWKTSPTGSGQFRQKEIDIVARKNGSIIFIEVKALLTNDKNPNRFLAEESVGPEKRKNLILASKFYLSSKRIPPDTPWRIDVISIEINPKTKSTKIYHFENEIY